MYLVETIAYFELKTLYSLRLTRNYVGAGVVSIRRHLCPRIGKVSARYRSVLAGGRVARAEPCTYAGDISAAGELHVGCRHHG
ncbi:MAG: hypothetical protein ACI8W7_001064 [Gammaproteobacteria bacterium]|jgi:hypothetical protein